MKTPIVIIGAGGFAREALDIIDAQGANADVEVVGTLADGRVDADKLRAYSVPHLGAVSDLHNMSSEVGYVIAIGSPTARAKIDEQFASLRRSPVLVHPTVTIGREVDLQPGTIVCAGSRLTNHISLARHVHVNLNCTVGHDTSISAYTTLSPSVSVSGNVSIGERTFVGTGAIIHPSVSIGANASLGSGTVVTKAVPPGVTIVGIPGRLRD